MMAFDLDQAIRDYCEQIHVAESQDAAIREELASHLRQKVDYYLNKGRLSEEEAFVLAKQTVGDPSEFLCGLRSVHRSDRVRGFLLRDLGTIGLLVVVDGTAGTGGMAIDRAMNQALYVTPTLLPLGQLTSLIVQVCIYLAVAHYVFGFVCSAYSRLSVNRIGLMTVPPYVQAIVSLLVICFLCVLFSVLVQSIVTALSDPRAGNLYIFSDFQNMHTLQFFVHIVNQAILTLLAFRLVTLYRGSTGRTFVPLFLAWAAPMMFRTVPSILDLVLNPANLFNGAVFLIGPVFINRAYIIVCGCVAGWLIYRAMEARRILKSA